MAIFSVKPGSEVKRVDYHMHSVFSDGKNEIKEYIKRAEDLGLSSIAITDHVWRSSEWVDEYVSKINKLNSKHDLEIIPGLEAKVIDHKGNVDVTEEDASKVEFIIGVFHQYRPKSDSPKDDILKLSPEKAKEFETKISKKILENQKVDVLGHPARTYYKFHYGNTTDKHYGKSFLREIVKKANEEDTLMEYNTGQSKRLRNLLLDLYVDEGLSFTIGSDSHSAKNLGGIQFDLIEERIN